MDRLLHQGKTYTQFEYSREAEFEKDVVTFASAIFGPKAFYIDIKRRIGQDNILSIPDGYLLDFSFESDPRLYIIENEIATHDPYRHIGQQLLMFATSYKRSGRQIQSFLLDEILNNKAGKKLVEEGLQKAKYRNIDAFLADVVLVKPVAAIVIIDEITDDLKNVLNHLTMKTDLIELQKFVCGNDVIHRFTPFQQEVRAITESTKPDINPEELDTIVVPAWEDGFKEVFIGQNAWWEIRISSAMIDRIKFIAAYQTAPTSAITYYAEVAKIEKYKDTGKYIVHFKEKAQKIGPIRLPTERGRETAPRSPRYTSFDRLRKAKMVSDLW